MGDFRKWVDPSNGGVDTLLWAMTFSKSYIKIQGHFEQNLFFKYCF